MLAPPLSAAEAAALPPPPPRLLRHLAALAAVGALVGYQFLLMEALGERVVFSYPGRLLTDALPLALMLPFLRRVGMSRWTFPLLGLLIPPVTLFVAWRLGYRLTSLPYRDWKPWEDEVPRVRRLPGTAYYVLRPLGSAPTERVEA